MRLDGLARSNAAPAKNLYRYANRWAGWGMSLDFDAHG